MYQHHIHDMARILVASGNATDPNQVEKVLSDYWADKVAIVWSTDDVRAAIDQQYDEQVDEKATESLITEDQAREALLEAFENHDAEYGIAWETLRYYARDVLSQAKVSE